MKRETATLSNLTATELIRKLIKRKKHFTFKDVEKKWGKKLTTADKFLIRSLVIKKFNMTIFYTSLNQLRFSRRKEKR